MLDWTNGFLRPPSPRVLPSVEGRTGVFDNNGDSWCESGIVTKDLVSYPEGVIIESDVYLQIANWNGCWVIEVSITRDKDSYWTHPNCPGEGYYNGASIGLYGYGDACWATPSQYRRHAVHWV